MTTEILRLRVDLLALAALMDERPDGEDPHVQQAWTAAADAIRATLGPPLKDSRRFEHCGFPESHEPHATTYTYCDGSPATDDVANLMERQLEVLRERDALRATLAKVRAIVTDPHAALVVDDIRAALDGES